MFKQARLSEKSVNRYLKAIQSRDENERSLRSRKKAEDLLNRAISENRGLTQDDIIKMQPWEKKYGNN